MSVTVRDKPILKAFNLQPINLFTELLTNLMKRRVLFEQQAHAKRLSQI